MRHYYCLISGLPDIGDGPLPAGCSMQECREWLLPQLGAGDRRLAGSLYLPQDNVLLLRACGIDDVPPHAGTGLYGSGRLEELVECVRADVPVADGMPRYMVRFVRMLLQGGLPAGMCAADVLWAMFHEEMAGCGNAFVASWHEWCRDRANVLSALAARAHGADVAGRVAGGGDVAESLRLSPLPDFGLMGRVYGMETLMAAASGGVRQAAERERMLDALGWRWLEEHAFMHHFTVERVFVFLARVAMLERWERIDPAGGRGRLLSAVEGLREGAARCRAAGGDAAGAVRTDAGNV